MNFQEAKQYLDSFMNFERDLNQMSSREFRLDRVLRLLELTGRPQDCFKTVHVAGTNGKGSTCVFISTILAKAGYKVGLYTSPHLTDLKERIRVLSEDDFDGEIKEEELSQILTDLKGAVESLRSEKESGRLTFFEVYTVLALSYFWQKKIDVAVLEVGLGGRLDATNAVDTEVACITPISLEHTQVLGETVEEIAGEKAAIIKNKNQKVVIAPQPPKALEVIQQRCRKFGITPLVVKENISDKISLLGEHQTVNASVAVGAIKLLQNSGFPVDDQTIKEGLVGTNWPGRFEVLDVQPKVVLDSAHNPASAKALAETFKECFPQQEAILVLGMSSDKDVEGVCAELNGIAKEVIITKAKHPRAVDPQDYDWQRCFAGKNVSLTGHMDAAFAMAQDKAQRNDVILVTGSIFIVGESRGAVRELCTS